MSVQHVQKWCREFSAGRKEVHDEERSGRPSVSEAVIEMVQREVLQNRRITVRELVARIPGSSYGTVERALTEKLGYHKCCARWVPRLLTSEHKEKCLECARQFLQKCLADKKGLLDSIVTGDETWVFHFTPETKQKSKQWRHSGSPVTKKFKQTPSAGKVMATVFWDRKGILLIDFMERGTTINADSYCATLRKLRRAIQNRRRHVSRQTQELLTQFGWTIMPHPPYSPDLAPSDYHLFPKLKEHLGGQRFRSDDDVKEEVKRFLNGLAPEFYDIGIQKLEHRLQKCVEKDGDYVEK